MKIGYFKKWLYTNCDQMLNFVNLKRKALVTNVCRQRFHVNIWVSCVHRCILDAMLRVLTFWDVNRTKRLLKLGFEEN